MAAHGGGGLAHGGGGGGDGGEEAAVPAWTAAWRRLFGFQALGQHDRAGSIALQTLDGSGSVAGSSRGLGLALGVDLAPNRHDRGVGNGRL
jgi:hypothetical protein